jgi:hypothetical protein
MSKRASGSNNKATEGGVAAVRFLVAVGGGGAGWRWAVSAGHPVLLRVQLLLLAGDTLSEGHRVFVFPVHPCTGAIPSLPFERVHSRAVVYPFTSILTLFSISFLQSKLTGKTYSGM